MAFFFVVEEKMWISEYPGQVKVNKYLGFNTDEKAS